MNFNFKKGNAYPKVVKMSQNEEPVDSKKKLLSIVVPLYNEEEVIDSFYKRLDSVLISIDMDAEILFVNDGSTDKTIEKLLVLEKDDPRIGIIEFSRNFGKENAMTAGLDFTSGDAVVVIDADLQDPPELIPEFIHHWQKGYDTVYAKRNKRAGESYLKKATARAFYYIINLMSNTHIPENTGDFRLISKRAVEALKQLPERQRFMKGLFSWIGFPHKEIIFDRDPRYAGNTSWNYLKLFKFAIDGITSFTVAPLKLSVYFGMFVSVFAFFYGAVQIFRTLVWGEPVAGYPSLMVVILFLGGVQLLSIGIIGEYLGRMFSEVKGRPKYLVKHYKPSRFSDLQDVKKT